MISEGEQKADYACELMRKLDSYPLCTRAEVEARNRFTQSLIRFLRDDNLDFEQFQNLIDSRFQQLCQALEEQPAGECDAEWAEYLALCSLLGLEPQPLQEYMLAEENRKLTQQYQRRRSGEILQQQLCEMLEEMGMTLDGEMELNELEGFLVLDEAVSDCSMFVNADGDGIIFEVMAEYEPEEGLSDAKKGRVREGMGTLCHKQEEIVRRKNTHELKTRRKEEIGKDEP